MGFYEDMEKSLSEAIVIEKAKLPLAEVSEMPGKTLCAGENEARLIQELVSLRKGGKISQKKLAALSGSKQQAVSRIENREHSPSLGSFCSLVNALGCELQIVKRV